jgi:hypothetical protein
VSPHYHQYSMRGGWYLYYEDRWYVCAVRVYVRGVGQGEALGGVVDTLLRAVLCAWKEREREGETEEERAGERERERGQREQKSRVRRV